MSRDQGIQRTERIRTRPEFEHVYERGRKVWGALLTLFAAHNERGRSRFGVAASRRVGGAVERNRAKRVAREIYRRHKLPAAVDVIVVPRRELLDAPFVDVEAEYTTLLARAARNPTRQDDAPRRGGPRRSSRL